MHFNSKKLSDLSTIAHGFFTRKGGVSEGIYASLNCGPGSNDDPSVVSENRRRVLEMLNAEDASLCTLYQIHSADVVAARVPWSRDSMPKADAMVSNVPNMMLGILTADCGPVLFADEKAGVVGAAHAGWKGAVGGVLANTISAMESMGAKREQITAVLGPCIAQESYEVGPEFYETFMQSDGSFHEHFESTAKGKYLFDLAGFIVRRLTESGLQQIESLGMNTYALEDEFFSYRRTTHKGEADYGRHISVIMLKGEEA